jgi:8-oxo-dGTP pyrophosphatase MutT (NUDIX family)
MTWKPDVTVAALTERDGKFLIVEERAGGRLVFNQPAGHLEDGETFCEAVVRETLEETAWHFVPQFIIGLYMWSPHGSRRSFLRIAFGGEVTRHDPGRSLDRGIVRTHWLTREQVLSRSPRLRSPLVLRCIDDFIAGCRYSLDAVTHLRGSPLEHVG